MSCSPCYRDCQIHTKTPVAQGPESCGRHHIQLLRETTAGYALEPLLDRRSSAVSPTTSQGHVMKPVDMLHPIAPDRPEDALKPYIRFNIYVSPVPKGEYCLEH